MIEAISGKGVHRAKAQCDECEREEVVTCDYVRGAGGDWAPNEGQVKKKLTAHGWAEVKGKLRCPTCEARRKVVPMKPKEAAAPAREMTKFEKIEIVKLLADVYDLDAGRYKNGDTDETVADVLGVMPGWVANIREADFGPDGGNENIEDLAARLGEAEKNLQAILESAAQQHEAATKKMAEVSAMCVELDRIKKAVGPRAMQRAGVR
ncbi:hypothetical protein [Salipiger abyssi]|nr:hypothetical protein [Salipiger abyssi]